MGKEQNYTAAYSAYLLAKSLGAAGMSDRMQLAQQKNIEKLQANALILQKNAARLAFQAGLQQAENLAETDLTQSLRLLEFLQQSYAGDRSTQNETAVLKTISEVTAGSGKPLYQAKSSRPAVDSDYTSEKDSLHSDVLPPVLQRATDSVFNYLPVPAHKPSQGIEYQKEKRGYYYSATHHLLFTFYAFSKSQYATILWRIDGSRLTRLHTFTDKFSGNPLLSPDGQMLAVRVRDSRSAFLYPENRLYAINEDNSVHY